MSRTGILDALGTKLAEVFRGYSLMNKAGVLQEVQVFAQYLPRARGITYSDSEHRSGKMSEYASIDYEANFPCIVVRIEDMLDIEEGGISRSTVNMRILTGIYDDGVICQGYRDILNMQDKIQGALEENRVLAEKYILRMPVKSKLLEGDTWPVWFGEQEVTYELGRPVENWEYIHGGTLRL